MAGFLPIFSGPRPEDDEEATMIVGTKPTLENIQRCIDEGKKGKEPAPLLIHRKVPLVVPTDRNHGRVVDVTCAGPLEVKGEIKRVDLTHHRRRDHK